MWQWAAFVFVAIVLYDRVSLYSKRQKLPGPGFGQVWPILGQLWQMITNPTQFYIKQAQYGPISWNSLAGNFVVFSKNTDITRKIFNSADKLRLWLIFGAKRILGDNNIAFLHGETHRELRRQLLPLFSRKALAVYLPTQETIIRQHMSQWFRTGEQAKPYYTQIRDLNIDTSTEVFVGPYMNDERRAVFNEMYNRIMQGMLGFPLAVPGTALWRAIQARKVIIPILEECARASRTRMAAGEEPKCLLDFWLKHQLELIALAENGQGERPSHTTDNEVAFTCLDFLFASQDASTSSLIWILSLLADHPEILAKVREEQARLRPHNEPVTYELLNEMNYTRQVVKETLRFRAPATMVPHIAVDDCPITDTYTIPKGTVVMPSIFEASFEGYPDAHTFDPDRFGPERAEDVKHSKQWLVFGVGPHLCLGKDYAVNHLMAFTAIVAMEMEWTRTRTAKSDDIVYLPTIFPADLAILTVKPRAATAAA